MLKTMRGRAARRLGHRATAGVAATALLCGAGAAVAAAPASADPGADIRCTTYQDGAWGKAHCFNWGTGSGEVRIRVTCSAWYDPDVTGDWIRLGPEGSTELAGNCWSAPTAIWTETR